MRRVAGNLAFRSIGSSARPAGIALAVAVATAIAAPSVSAATLYWDADTSAANNAVSGAGLGGTGNWNTSSSGTPLSNWWPGTGATDQSWTNAGNHTAVFTGAAGPV